MSGQSDTNVLLLRAPGGDNNSPDKYEASFTSHGYHVVSITVLETALVNTPNLCQVISEGPGRRGLDGVIVTSARASEAWRFIVERLVQEPEQDAVPFYVVGDATASSLAEIQEIPSSQKLSPKTIRGGRETGSGEKLAHFILDELGQDTTRTLLYLTGDKNRDTLPKILEGGGVKLESLQVYETKGSSRFPDDLKQALGALPKDDVRWWIVYFAPSAADFVTPVLREHFSIPVVGDASPPHLDRVRIAAIGPTTSAFLCDTLHLRVHVTSPKPSPDALALAIKQFDNQDA